MKFELQSLAQPVVKTESRELTDPFPLVKELFDFAREKVGDEVSYEIYANPEFQDREQKLSPLPERFRPLVAEYPGEYFVVYYSNRLDSRNASGTRYQSAMLSTHKHRYDTDQKIREIEIRQHAPSEGRGNVVLITVRDRVKEKSFLNVNTAGEGEINEPAGWAKITHEVNSTGDRRFAGSLFSRMDEGIFEWKGEQKPVRWNRDLRIDRLTQEVFEMTYEDSYLIGRDEKGLTEERARVRINILGKGEKTSSIMIEIGMGVSAEAEVLFEDREEDMRIIVYAPEGKGPFENQLDVIKQDPSYAFMFEKPVDKKKFMDFVRSRVTMLQNDWDKPQPVFGGNRLEDPGPSLQDARKEEN